MDNLVRVLAAADTDLGQVVQTRNYLREEGDLPRYNQLYREYFKAPLPARTTIVRCLPSSMRYEIEAIAVKKKSP
jgi:2-iminobutanoate/2-iminopropanoate deaminase